jgi:DNA-binding LacI/PurR family transcriptional regulator
VHCPLDQLADLLDRPITVVSYDAHEVGRHAATLLLDHLGPGTPPDRDHHEDRPLRLTRSSSPRDHAADRHLLAICRLDVVCPDR